MTSNRGFSDRGAVFTDQVAAAAVLDRLLHVGVERVAFLSQYAWLLAPATLAVAGAYQFTKLKYRCLDKCRSPLLMVTQHWHGTAESRSAIRGLRREAMLTAGGCAISTRFSRMPRTVVSKMYFETRP